METRHWVILAAAAVLLMVGAAFGMMAWVVITGGGPAAQAPTRAPTLDVLATPTLSSVQIEGLIEQNSTLQAEVESLQSTLGASSAATPAAPAHTSESEGGSG